MKAINALKVVMASAVAVTALHFGLQSAADRFVAGTGEHPAQEAAEPVHQVMVTQTPQWSSPAPSRDTAFGEPDPDYGQAHPAAVEAATPAPSDFAAPEPAQSAPAASPDPAPAAPPPGPVTVIR